MKQLLFLFFIFLWGIAQGQSPTCSSQNDTITEIDTLASLQLSAECGCDTFVLRTTILIVPNCCCVHTLTIHLASLSIQTAHSTPIILPLPFLSGYYYDVISFGCKLTFNSVSYASSILTVGALSSLPSSFQFFNSCLTTTQNLHMPGSCNGLQNDVGTSYVTGDSLGISADADSLGIGNSDVDCTISYLIIKDQ